MDDDKYNGDGDDIDNDGDVDDGEKPIVALGPSHSAVHFNHTCHRLQVCTDYLPILIIIMRKIIIMTMQMTMMMMMNQTSPPLGKSGVDSRV